MQLRMEASDVESELTALHRQLVSAIWHVEVMHALMQTFRSVGPVDVVSPLTRYEKWERSKSVVVRVDERAIFVGIFLIFSEEKKKAGT